MPLNVEGLPEPTGDEEITALWGRAVRQDLIDIAADVTQPFGDVIDMEEAVPGVSIKDYVDAAVTGATVPNAKTFTYTGRRLTQVDDGDVRLVISWSGNRISSVLYQNPAGTTLYTYTPTYSGRKITAWAKA